MYRVVVELAETNCHKLDPTLGNGEHCIINPSEDHEVRCLGFLKKSLYDFLLFCHVSVLI